LTELDTDYGRFSWRKRSLGMKRKRKRAMRRRKMRRSEMRRREMRKMRQFHTMTWNTM
jgi:hypothetical protein